MPEKISETGDERLRQLERRWRESGVVGDEAEYLKERIRRGEVKDGDAMLAAFLGDPAALALTDEVPPQVEDLNDWVEQIAQRGGLPVRIREARVIVNTIIETEGAIGDAEEDSQEFTATMEILDQYLENPSKESAQAFIDSADSILGEIPRDTIGQHPTTGSVSAYMLLLRDLAVSEVEEEVSIPQMNPERIIEQLVRLATNEEFGAGLSEDQIRQAIQADLIPYLLSMEVGS